MSCCARVTMARMSKQAMDDIGWDGGESGDRFDARRGERGEVERQHAVLPLASRDAPRVRGMQSLHRACGMGPARATVHSHKVDGKQLVVRLAVDVLARPVLGQLRGSAHERAHGPIGHTVDERQVQARQLAGSIGQEGLH